MRWASLAVACVVWGVRGALAIDINACGQHIPDRDIGVLQADLDCSADPPTVHVSLGERATLNLNGHALVSSVGSYAVQCAGKRCTVHGPGDISGGQVGISALRNLEVRDLTIHDTFYGIYNGIGLLEVTDVDVTNTAGAIHSAGRVRATNVTASNNRSVGISAIKTFYGTNVVASNNGGAGVSCGRFKVTGLTAVNNGLTPNRQGAGLRGLGGKIESSTLTGNQYSAPFLGAFAVDVFTNRRPQVVSITCDRSNHVNQQGQLAGPWGVCAAD